MRKLMIVLACALTACMGTKIDVQHENQTSNAAACQRPAYVATVAKVTGTVSETGLELNALLRDAQTNYGNDCTIQNIRYDRENGKKVAAVYDVIRCDTTRISK